MLLKWRSEFVDKRAAVYGSSRASWHVIIIIIIIIINCNWVVTQWQWLFYMCMEYEIGY